MSKEYVRVHPDTTDEVLRSSNERGRVAFTRGKAYQLIDVGAHTGVIADDTGREVVIMLPPSVCGMLLGVGRWQWCDAQGEEEVA